jgi:hypothetical protein
MLKKFIIINAGSLLAACLVMMTPSIVPAAGFEDQLSIDSQTLYLNGQGPRKKAFLTVYDTALYLTEKGSDAQAIIEADHPMAISLVLRSRFATAERISEAFREGLEKATGGNTVPIKAQTEEFLGIFQTGVEKNDAFQFVYLPDVGTKIFKNGEAAKSIKGFEFKQALFGIWLSDNPIAAKLKSQLLGQ